MPGLSILIIPHSKNWDTPHITTLKTTYHQLGSLDAIATCWGSRILQAVVAARLEKELFLDVFALSTS